MIGPGIGGLRRSVIAFATASLVACAGEADTPPAAHVDDLPRLSYVEAVRIGSFDDPEAGFSRIGSVEVGADGSVYVAEVQATEIRVFSPSGDRIRTVGRGGEGPGEFSRPGVIGLLGDTLWVRDSNRGRIFWFGPDGTLLHETPRVTIPVDTDVPGMTLQVTVGHPREDGLIGSTYHRAMNAGAADRPFSYPVVRFDRDGAVVDTVRWDTEIPDPTFSVEGMALHTPTLGPTQPLAVEAGPHDFKIHWRVSESGAEGKLQVVRISEHGDTLGQGLLRYDAIPVPESVRDSILEPFEGLAYVFGFSERSYQSALESALELPDHRPPLRSADAGRDGSLWIELTGTSPDSSTWALFDPTLTPLGLLALPSSMSPRHIDGATAWVVDSDEFDVPWLVRLDVR